MIPKILCWLFGHRFHDNFFTGKTAELTDRLTGALTTQPVNIRLPTPTCLRCNVLNPNYEAEMAKCRTEQK
jgi:hypothetical protein